MLRNRGIAWISPWFCKPPHGVSRPEQVISLAESFKTGRGWALYAPALVGYHLDERNVQLLSGSHRWAAAIEAGMPMVPVRLHPRAVVEAAWGNLGHWVEIMRPVMVIR